MDQHRDEHLTCANCGTSFLFSAAEARLFTERGLTSPKRCKDCRRARKEQGLAGGDGRARAGHAGHAGPAGNAGPRRDGGAYAGPPRYTGDVNEYRSPMRDDGFVAVRWNDTSRPRPARALGARPQPNGNLRRGGSPEWSNDGIYRSPMSQNERRDGVSAVRPRAAAPAAAAARKRPQAEMHTITCNACGEASEVPFKPAEGREVFCQACYRARRPQA